jgi:hypothetical protein
MLQFKRTEHHFPYALEHIVGALPYCWDANDPRPAKEQHDEKQMGNGPWHDFKGKFKLDPETYFLKYPGDTVLKPLAIGELPLTKEKIIVYAHAWVVILQENGDWTVDRRD